MIIIFLPVPRYFIFRAAKKLANDSIASSSAGKAAHKDLDTSEQSPTSDAISAEVIVPADKLGLVVGRNGETIRRLQVEI